MRVLIFGLGLIGGGLAAANYFLDHGHEVRITDLRSEAVLGEPLEMLKKRGALAICQQHREEDFRWADVVIKNPAVADSHPLLSLAKRVETDISYLFASSYAPKMKILAITGTKGKTTTAAAVAHVLNFVQKEAIQCGNMGISGFSVLSDLENREKEGRALPRYLVCELSSWQIRDVHAIMGDHMPTFRLVVLTSLFPDHLNVYSDFTRYKEDKWLLLMAKSEQILVAQQTYHEVKSVLGTAENRLRAIEEVPLCNKQDARMRPAWAVCRTLGVSARQISAAFSTFGGVPHRQEQVALYRGITFINDSSATIPQAVAFCCTFCPWPYVLICGGADKNLSAEDMLEAMKGAQSIHLLDGSFTKNKIIPLLRQEGIVFHGPYESMEEAVRSAFHDALEASQQFSEKQPIALILSPGAASFGLFKHEFDRGDQFKLAVKQLVEQQES